VAFWGAVDIGAILVGLNGWWKTDEVVYGLQDSGAKVLVADGRRFERVAALAVRSREIPGARAYREIRMWRRR
jgi:acyl-CoA synthetase (AMP-forming)/AMP-acid ligase II